MSRGIQRERAVRDWLIERDWIVVRAAGSLGGGDLVALRAGCRSRLVEVKSTAAGPYERFGPTARRRLALAAEWAGADAYLAWWPPRGKLSLDRLGGVAAMSLAREHGVVGRLAQVSGGGMSATEITRCPDCGILSSENYAGGRCWPCYSKQRPEPAVESDSGLTVRAADLIGPYTSAAVNVLLGWLGFPVPPMPRQRNRTRARYRKTSRTRSS